jgi:predicted O-linked N-acetylglucosamine transferase (SPINDLY family)
MNLQDQAYQSLRAGDYEQAAQQLAASIEQHPEALPCYWYLGLAHLLAGQEAEAQSTWMYALAQADESQLKEWTQDLTEILETEAQYQEEQQHPEQQHRLRLQLSEIAPDNLQNLLFLVALELKLGVFEPQRLQELGLCQQLQGAEVDLTISEVLQQVFPQVVAWPSHQSLALAQASYRHLQPSWLTDIVFAAVKASYELNQHHYAIDLIELCLQLEPQQLSALEHLPRLHLRARQYQAATQAALSFLSLCNTLPLQTIGNFLYLDTLMQAGAWSEVLPVYENQKVLLEQLVAEHPTNLTLGTVQGLIVKTSLLSYLQDHPVESRRLQNQVAQLFVDNIQANTTVTLPLYAQNPRKSSKKRLKIGYIGNTFRKHSVGWLCRWLFQYHDRDQFEIALYSPALRSHDPFFQTWFGSRVDSFFEVDADITAIAEQISADQVDILVDLDSTTLDYTCSVMALKPAPIQVTWLGLDASGLPTIDYFIADPYVLPENAQDYYREKIWRLPQTYLAVDGFETDIPTLRRDELGIPADAVVYLSAQAGFKRFPETMRLQMQIIKAVPNSYFLIKGLADETKIQDLFFSIAEEAGVSVDRLKFLPLDSNEYVHRANLNIADVVLDTYPYNGATTTLETLWMGIPIVTKVGKQFAARNSYTFMINAGIKEGIAWTDDEYIEWGIRIGTDLGLRQKISFGLRKSRQESPLWNTQDFTRQLENTYLEMWQIYIKTR